MNPDNPALTPALLLPLLLWGVALSVFLLERMLKDWKTSTFRNFFLRQRLAARTLIACLAAAIVAYGGSKPGGSSSSGNGSSSGTKQGQKNATGGILANIVRGQTPPWWTDDPTDTDEDGIPDKWEIWTRSDPNDPNDADLPRIPGDLTRLEKFHLQLDPRVRDTLGDGVHDTYKALHGVDFFDDLFADRDDSGSGLNNRTKFLLGLAPSDTNRVRLGVSPSAHIVHGEAFTVGFAAVLTAGSAANVSWSANIGAVTPETGAATLYGGSTLSPPPGGDPAMVFATLGDLVGTGVVTYCGIGWGLGLTLSTNDFSPHLGESVNLTVKTSGCPHFTPWEGCEMEGVVEWEGTNKTQVIHTIFTETIPAGMQEWGYTWHGDASGGQFTSPDIFPVRTNHYHRIYPTANGLAPPPFADITVRIYTNGFVTLPDGTTTPEKIPLASDTKRVHIPQVVKVDVSDSWEIRNLLTAPLVYTNSITKTTQEIMSITNTADIVHGLYNALSNALGKRLPPSTNVRVVNWLTSPSGDYKSLILCSSNRLSVGWAPTDSMNTSIKNTAHVNIEYLRMILLMARAEAEGDSVKEAQWNNALPLSVDQVVYMLALIATHEIGHTLGLVASQLDGDSNNHDNEGGVGYFMHTNITISQLMGFAPAPVWKIQHEEYLKFILPLPSSTP